MLDMKRKASTLDESVSTSDWTSFDYSSSSTSTSPESVKAITDRDRFNLHWNTNAIPYFNSRTRKRHRDGRPDEDTIHQNTLAKLFSAQRQLNTGHNQREPWQYTAAVAAAPSPSVLFAQTSFIAAPALSQPETNQRSIDSFFGGSFKQRVQKTPQRDLFAFSNVQTKPRWLPTCDDCSAPLQTLDPDVSMTGDDSMCMDSTSQHDEWACGSCHRRVCNTCAVQGDQRTCLECAVPGGG